MKGKIAKLVSLAKKHFCLTSILLWSFFTASAQKQVSGVVKVMPKIVPEHDVSLRSGNKIKISIDGIGSLLNEVE